MGTGVSAIVMVWAGVLTDIFRTRVLGAIVLIGLALACVAMASIPHAFLLPFVICPAFFGQGMCCIWPSLLCRAGLSPIGAGRCLWLGSGFR